MLDYRLYLMRTDGHIQARVDLQCVDDGHAIEVAQDHIGDRAMELWQADRKVQDFPTEASRPTGGSH